MRFKFHSPKHNLSTVFWSRSLGSFVIQLFSNVSYAYLPTDIALTSVNMWLSNMTRPFSCLHILCYLQYQYFMEECDYWAIDTAISLLFPRVLNFHYYSYASSYVLCSALLISYTHLFIINHHIKHNYSTSFVQHAKNTTFLSFKLLCTSATTVKSATPEILWLKRIFQARWYSSTFNYRSLEH